MAGPQFALIKSSGAALQRATLRSLIMRTASILNSRPDRCSPASTSGLVKHPISVSTNPAAVQGIAPDHLTVWPVACCENVDRLWACPRQQEHANINLREVREQGDGEIERERTHG